MVSHDTRERTRLFTSGASLELRLIAWLVLFEGYCGWLDCWWYSERARVVGYGGLRDRMQSLKLRTCCQIVSGPA